MDKLFNFSAASAIVIRHLILWRRNLDRLIDAFWWSTVDLIFWGLTSSYLKKINIDIPDVVTFFLGGLIFWSFIQNAQRDINMPLLIEAWDRNLVNVFASPIRLREFIMGTIILGLIKLSFSVLTFFILSFILYQFNIFKFGLYLIPAIINLILMGWWVGFLIDGLILRYGFRVEAFAWALVFVAYPFSAVLYPVAILPEWAKIIASLLPSSYVFENMRNVIFTGTFSSNGVIVSVLLNILYISLSLIFLKYMFQQALKHARLVKMS